MLSNINTLNPIFTTVAPKMNSLTKLVHEIVLGGDYLANNSINIEKSINKIAVKAGLELLDKAFVGKLRHKLPPLGLDNTWHVFDKEKAKLIASALISQYLIDSEVFQVREELIVATVNEVKTYRKERFMIFNKETSVKELLEGYESRPAVLKDKTTKAKVGGKELKYGSEQKAMSKLLSSQEFKVSDVCTEEILQKGYELSKGYQAVIMGKTNEDPILMKRRYENYAKAIMSLKEQGKFYLTNWFDSRTRMYYHGQLEGIRPQGKLWETLMIDVVEPYIIDDVGVKHLIHIIMVTLHGRMSLEHANASFMAIDIDAMDAIDPLEATTLDEFGDAILLQKCGVAYDQYLNKQECYYIFGKDLTNSGIGIAGNAFRSIKMMIAGNYGGIPEAIDSHTQFAESYGLERELIKSAHTGLLHGSTFKSMAKELCGKVLGVTIDKHLLAGDTLEAATLKAEVESRYITEAYVREAAIKAYGIEILNVGTIASYGSDIVNNSRNTLLWTCSDGWKAQSTAYMEKVAMDIYVISSKNTSGYATWKLISDMPLKMTSKGYHVFTKEDGVTTKKRGLYANIVHSVDATLKRAVYKRIHNLGYAAMFKHDDYMTALNAFDDVIEVVQDSMEGVRETNPFDQALTQIKASHNTAIELPSLLVGKAPNTISSSVNFIMP